MTTRRQAIQRSPDSRTVSVGLNTPALATLARRPARAPLRPALTLQRVAERGHRLEGFRIWPAERESTLPPSLKTSVEGLSGLSLNSVRVHYNSARAAEVEAAAITQGDEIHIGPGQEKHLAHEAWHVVQQRQGRVTPTGRLSGLPVNASDALEQEADRMGAQALRTSPQGNLHPAVVQPSGTAPIQRMSWNERNGLVSSDYPSATFNTVTNSGYHLFTLRHRLNNPNYHIQVHWHPVSENFADESWTVRWANEQGGNKAATEWMKQKCRATAHGTQVALASQSTTGGGGAEYQTQFPALGAQ